MKVDHESLEQMQARGGTWACYENKAMDSTTLGHRITLKVGPDCTHKTPPEHLHDGAHGTGWKYRYIGMVNLETGEIA